MVKELGEAITALEKSKDVKGVIVTSGKNVFIVGADITEFGGVFDAGPDAIADMLKDNNVNNCRLEELPFPVVAAINGYALGGGFELALACDYRVLSKDAKVGFPEVQLGLLPGWGETVRMPRITGADTAIAWIASAKEQRAGEALKVGAVDAVVDGDKVRDAALHTVKQCMSGNFDYKARREQKMSPLPMNMMETMMSFETSKAFVGGTAGPNYPAPVEAIKVMQKASMTVRRL